MIPDELPIREPNQIRHGCASKRRAVRICDHFQTILGSLLREYWNTPRLVETVITSNGHVLGRCDCESSFKAFLSAFEDLVKNIHGVVPVAELDGHSIGHLVVRVAEIKRLR